MYGKIFEQIYNSTVCQDWKTLIVFQQCIILSDDLGILDMTPESISRRTGIPTEIILHGIKELEKPDLRSRSKKSEGRRLELIDEHRDWGWVVVNKVEYRKLASRLEKQNNDRERIAKKREKQNKIINVAKCREVSQDVVDVAHTDTETNTNTNTNTKELLPKIVTLSGKPDVHQPNFISKAKEVLEFLNKKANRNYRPNKTNLEFIVSRLKDGATLEECFQVIAKKTREWKTDEKMALYLRPATIFNKTKFAQYQGELISTGE